MLNLFFSIFFQDFQEIIDVYYLLDKFRAIQNFHTVKMFRKQIRNLGSKNPINKKTIFISSFSNNKTKESLSSWISKKRILENFFEKPLFLNYGISPSELSPLILNWNLLKFGTKDTELNTLRKNYEIFYIQEKLKIEQLVFDDIYLKKFKNKKIKEIFFHFDKFLNLHFDTKSLILMHRFLSQGIKVSIN
ncbi:hypothetical protein BpHYR1_050641 [Brachionus plicatilis]|uniref:Uncharacterized protein n=1 Tax=Brachionus plicatilis TaxID=10195 RepID=A0A3M7QLF8_BRAPC|nr:hypothetical protein BpHYR1_050641 [Brachionus plicatilis]